VENAKRDFASRKDRVMPLDPRLAGAAAAQHGLFTTAQALAAGYSEHEIKDLLRGKQWSRLRRGIYVETTALPLDEQTRHVLMARAALHRLRPPAHASHVTAAAAHRLVLLEPDLSVLHITRPGTSTSRVEADVHHHAGNTPPGHLIVVDGLAVTDIARTIVDYARESTFEQGIVTAEAALWAKQTSSEEIRSALLECRDWPGARNAGRVVSFASSLSQSPGESISRICFAEHGVPEPRQQVAFHDGAGLIGLADFYWEEQATVAEFDGRLKYEGENADMMTLYAEKRREDRLRALGLEIVRFGWYEARYQGAALARRLEAAFGRGSRSMRRKALA